MLISECNLQIPVVNYIFRESLKRKASDAETVSLNLLSLKFIAFNMLVKNTKF